MIINNPKAIESLKFMRELDDAGIDNTGITPTPKTLLIGVKESDESAAMAVYEAHDPSPEIVHEITPIQSLIIAGNSVEVRVTGAPDSIETIYVNGLSQDVDLDEDGIVVIDLIIGVVCDVYITDDHNNIAKVEVR